MTGTNTQIYNINGNNVPQVVPASPNEQTMVQPYNTLGSQARNLWNNAADTFNRGWETAKYGAQGTLHATNEGLGTDPWGTLGQAAQGTLSTVQGFANDTVQRAQQALERNSMLSQLSSTLGLDAVSLASGNLNYTTTLPLLIKTLIMGGPGGIPLSQIIKNTMGDVLARPSIYGTSANGVNTGVNFTTAVGDFSRAFRGTNLEGDSPLGPFFRSLGSLLTQFTTAAREILTNPTMANNLNRILPPEYQYNPADDNSVSALLEKIQMLNTDLPNALKQAQDQNQGLAEIGKRFDEEKGKVRETIAGLGKADK